MDNFTGYSKIQNISNAKMIRFIGDLGLNKQQYEVREKIHGSNFQIADFPTGEIKFGRRKDYLAEDENFHGYEKMTVDFANKMETLRKLIPFSSTAVIKVFGEIFGGTFYGSETDDQGMVQAGVQYHPQIKFMAFDIMVNGEYLQGMDTYTYLKAAGFDQAPVIAITNTLEEALAMPVDFTSTVPGYYGLECKPDNLAEGYVIKPCRGNERVGNYRLILKYKSKAWAENAGTRIKKTKIQAPLSQHDCATLIEYSAYVTQNRLDNVLSKESKLIGKDFSRIVGMITQDALADFRDDYEVSIKNLDDTKQFKREANRLAMELLREKWAEIITEV